MQFLPSFKHRFLIYTATLYVALWSPVILEGMFEVNRNVSKTYKIHQNLENGNQSTFDAALVVLLSASTVDMTNMKEAIISIDTVIAIRFPLIIFIEPDFPPHLQNMLRSKSCRRVYFSTVNFTAFPDGFNPRSIKSSWVKRSKWGYQQMCRFWATLIWEENLIQQFKYIMRIDSDSYYRSPLPGTFPILTGGVVYVANGVSTEASFVCKKIFNVVTDYLKNNQIIPKNRIMWNYAEKIWNQSQEIPMFYNNFEIARTDFFTQKCVLDFLQAMTETKPFYSFIYRWGDAVIRFLTMAIFSLPHEIIVLDSRFFYDHPGPNALAEKFKIKKPMRIQ